MLVKQRKPKMDTGDIFKSIAKGLGAIAPTVANIALPGSGPMLAGLMRAVTGDSVDIPLEQVAKKIQTDPKLMVELEDIAMKREVGLAQVEATKLESVNATMRQESKSDHFMQYAWRPFNGFMFPITVFSAYVILPVCGVASPVIPVSLIVGWLSILGVATVGRNKEKVAKAGNKVPGMFEGLINAIKS
jgi:hypothetical protein